MKNRESVTWKNSSSDFFYFFFLRRLSPTRAQVASLLRFLHHTQLGTHIQQDFSEGVIGLSQRLLSTRRTTNTRDEHPCRQRSQQSSSFRPTVQKALPPGSALRHPKLQLNFCCLSAVGVPVLLLWFDPLCQGEGSDIKYS